MVTAQQIISVQWSLSFTIDVSFMLQLCFASLLHLFLRRLLICYPACLKLHWCIDRRQLAPLLRLVVSQPCGCLAASMHDALSEVRMASLSTHAL